MQEITNKDYYVFNLDEEGLIIDGIYNSNGDNVFCVPMSFDSNIMKKNIKSIKRMFGNGQIIISKGLALAFNVGECCDELSYEQWKYLIDFAKDNNINFRVNLREEYSPKEMENYVDCFVVNDKKGRRFVFEDCSMPLKDNPIKRGRDKDESIFQTIDNLIFLYTDYIDSEMESYSKNMINQKKLNYIGFSITDGKNLDSREYMNIKKGIDYLIRKYPDRKIGVIFCNASRYYTKEQFLKLLEIENYIKNNYNPDYELKFSADGVVYSKNNILIANEKINTVVSKLKKSNMSPYEKIMLVSKMLNENQYYMSYTNSSLSRDVYSILNTRNIICSGYANLMKVIFEELQDENIKVQVESVVQLNCLDNEKFHAINCVYIKDEKYGIEGYYNLDINYYEKDNYTHFMTPVNDINGFYARDSRKSFKATETNQGNMANQTMPIVENNGKSYTLFNKLKNTPNWQSKVLSNTKEFFNTPMGRKIISEMGHEIICDEDALYVINEIVKRSDIIPVEVTGMALEKISQDFLGVDEEESREYSKNIIMRDIFYSLFRLERKVCDNDFARKSIQIERKKLVLGENKRRV